MIGDNAASSTRPYLIRALHDWCTDNGFTPYIAVHVDDTVEVPTEYVKNAEIVLNVGFEATSGLELGNEFIVFKARFGGVARDITVPVDHVVAIYARENGQGMAFPLSAELQAASTAGPTTAPAGSGVGSGAPSPSDTSPKAGLRLATSADTPAPPAEPQARKPRAPRTSATGKPTAVPAPVPGAEKTRPKKSTPKPDDTPPTEPTPPGRPTLTRIK